MLKILNDLISGSDSEDVPHLFMVLKFRLRMSSDTDLVLSLQPTPSTTVLRPVSESVGSVSRHDGFGVPVRTDPVTDSITTEILLVVQSGGSFLWVDIWVYVCRGMSDNLSFHMYLYCSISRMKCVKV